MEHPTLLRIEDYTYDLPDERIAKYPLEVRDASKLLIYKDGHIKEDSYRNISAHIPAETLLVFNQTKVVHARLLFQKSTGSTIEVFCLEPHQQYADIQTAMMEKRTVLWNCMVGGAAKWKQDMVLTLTHQTPAFVLSAQINERNADSFTIEFSWDNDMSFAEVLHFAGKVPLPPYLHREAEAADEGRYQTIFAKDEGSVAAPTAGLHFTDAVIDSLKQKNIDTAFVTLHVGAGTFKPVKSGTMLEHTMHAEWIDVDIATIEMLIAHLDKGIVAVGTTSMRTLESLYWIGVKTIYGFNPGRDEIAITQWEPYELAGDTKPEKALQTILTWMQETGQNRLVTRTQILIAPGYTPKIIKGLITNFHQPRSTLLLLVAALIGKNWRDVYNYALDKDYRFLSYGDGCLLWR